MNSEKLWDRNLVSLLVVGLGFAMFLLFYFIPRSRALSQTKTRAQELSEVRQEVSLLLPEVARTAFTTPLPQPNVQSWIANSALKGLKKNVVANDGYDKGQGAQVKLRRLRPGQAAAFLSSLTQVRLVVERMQLEDSDQDGRWDLTIRLKVPKV